MKLAAKMFSVEIYGNLMKHVQVYVPQNTTYGTTEYQSYLFSV